MEALNIHANKYPELKLIFHVPNGGKRNKFEAAIMSGMGVKSGVLDYFLPVARSRYHGLWTEMKSEKGRLSESQQWWREQLAEQGYKVVVCYDWESAVTENLNYIKGLG